MIEFRACDTSWRIGATTPFAAEKARERVLDLEKHLNAFDPASRVAALNRDGSIVDAHIARMVVRAREYAARTSGVFDIARGSLEHALKAYLRGDTAALPGPSTRATYHVDGERVTTSAPLDLNGVAKGYIVDEAQRALTEAGGIGFVDGGGDIAGPTGPVAIESPYSPAERIGVLDTRWNIATSGIARRRRGKLDHLYDASSARVGARHDQVTVLARRDCVEADVLATTLAVMPLDQGAKLLQGWQGVEALWVNDGSLFATEGFHAHIWNA